MRFVLQAAEAPLAPIKAVIDYHPNAKPMDCGNPLCRDGATVLVEVNQRQTYVCTRQQCRRWAYDQLQDSWP